MSDEQLSGSSLTRRSEASIRTHDCMINIVEGVVHSQHVGLVHTTVRIRAGRRVDMCVRLPIDDARCFFPGQPVIATIPAEAVRLEAGLFRRSRQRLNRWHGRIVLVRSHREGHMITAKMHGERLSLTSASPVVGSGQRVQTWDSVNIVVDPHAIELVLCEGPIPMKPETLFQTRLVCQ